MDEKRKFRPNPDLKLMDQVKEVLRYHHYAYRTEQTYCDWVLRFLRSGYDSILNHPLASSLERAAEAKVELS